MNGSKIEFSCYTRPTGEPLRRRAGHQKDRPSNSFSCRIGIVVLSLLSQVDKIDTNHTGF